MASVTRAAVAEIEPKVLEGQSAKCCPLDPLWGRLQVEIMQAALPGTNLTQPTPGQRPAGAALEQTDVADVITAGAGRHGECGSRTVCSALGTQRCVGAP